jgi:hypothetical protein
MRSVRGVVPIRFLIAVVALFCALPGASFAASDATLLRLFLSDGTRLVSYGEFARVEDRVIFSMPVGGTAEQPRLHVVTIPANVVDWDRTDRYAASARYQHYSATRGEDDFSRLSNDVARVLNEVALTTDPHKALQIAEQARHTLADWPRQHYGYRQRDVREIVSLLDEAISDLRAAAGIGAFDLSFVALAADVPLEPMYGMPAPREMVSQLLAVANLAERPAERVALLQSALALVHEAGLGVNEGVTLEKVITLRLREELQIAEKYARLSKRWLEAASRASARAQVRDVEAVLARINREDRRLGRRRPDVVQALNASVHGHLENARRLRLLRDQWLTRRSAYREYERSVSSLILQLVKAQPALDAIKRLEGPSPSTLSLLRAHLDGGSTRLQRLTVTDEVRAAHEMLVGAWQFAETAVRTRQDAIASADMTAAWRASSAAAGALLMLSRVQGEIRSLLEPPQLR